MPQILRTVRGDVPIEQLGLFLPHEHLFTDLRGPSAPDYAQGDPEDVAATLLPNLQAAERAGVTAFVECSTPGVGRNVAILSYLAERTSIHIVAPTGVYREAFFPTYAFTASESALAERWTRDILDGMDDTTVRAGFIKIAMSDDGPTHLEERNLRAAARASLQTGAVVASHTIGGRAALRELDVLEGAGLGLNRFIWVHAQTEPDTTIHRRAAQRGAWVEFDTIGVADWHERQLDYVIALLDAGYVGNILLSHDAGWYQPGQPHGVPPSGLRGYTALVDEFIPALLERGVDEATIHQLTHTNPAHAFAFTTK